MSAPASTISVASRASCLTSAGTGIPSTLSPVEGGLASAGLGPGECSARAPIGARTASRGSVAAPLERLPGGPPPRPEDPPAEEAPECLGEASASLARPPLGGPDPAGAEVAAALRDPSELVDCLG